MCEKPEEPADLALMEPVLEEYGGRKGTLIPVLQQAQALYGYLPRPVLNLISKRLRIPMSKIYGVATFYSQFYLERRGRHVVKVCDGTACHVKGGRSILKVVRKELGLEEGETSPDNQFTLETVACLGTCFLAPTLMVNKTYFGKLSPPKVNNILTQYGKSEQNDIDDVK